MFNIKQLDHVAIAVRDVEQSARWYQENLGLERVRHESWGNYPVMIMANETGIALFPAKTENPSPLPEGDFIVAKHFAFNLDKENFEKAKQYLKDKGVYYYFEDHVIYHSIYMTDPDGYKVELTTEINTE